VCPKVQRRSIAVFGPNAKIALLGRGAPPPFQVRNIPWGSGPPIYLRAGTYGITPFDPIRGADKEFGITDVEEQLVTNLTPCFLVAIPLTIPGALSLSNSFMDSDRSSWPRMAHQVLTSISSFHPVYHAVACDPISDMLSPSTTYCLPRRSTSKFVC
jgi:hypothetical protein